MRFFVWLVVLALFLGGCAVGRGAERDEAVPEEELAAFLAMLETDDYHAIERRGEEIFREGLYIPDHQALFAKYPAEDLPQGQIRYDLLLIEGEAGMAWVHLFLEKETGKIIQFSAGEATFE